MSNPPREACGVVGVFTPGEDAARAAFFGLFSLQHRGQESAGIAVSDGINISCRKEMGLVSQAFHEFDLSRLQGHIAIGHTRYSTTGSTHLSNAQPLEVEGVHGRLALAHNGNVINALPLRDEMERDWGCRFATATDSEVIAQMLANAPGKDWNERITYLMRRLQGAYSLTVLTENTLIAIRDPLGVRPLCIGVYNGGWVVASESCALDQIGASLLRELEPGEAIQIDADGQRTILNGNEGKRSICSFEYIYFARPDSILEKRPVHSARREMGKQLALQAPVDADMVMGIPDSAIAAGVGYAEAAGIPYQEGLIKNRYVGRTFIQPDQKLRDLGVRLKFNPLPEVLTGKRVVVVDDSIVRGTTTPHVVNLLRSAGAKEVHLRVCAPPIVSPCHFGVDMASKGELLAAQKSIEEIREFIGADSLEYLTVDGLFKAIGKEANQCCAACFTGQYPIEVQLELDKMVLERN
ncbi:MAG: amidophosphoribosyltransferase [Chloroflexota bacterium]|nr:amidophosphoribosyltransferase [Chloroflexota bacterium]MEE2656441.1 amidophosphoribosyltransferase [Chloroflexota bacterium]